MPIDGGDRSASAARLAERDRAEQAPVPISSPQLPPRKRTQTGSDSTLGLVVTDDTQHYKNGFLPESPELVAQDDVLPAYSEFPDQLNIHQAGFDAGAAVTGISCALPLLSPVLLANGPSWQMMVGSTSTSTRRADTLPISSRRPCAAS